MNRTWHMRMLIGLVCAALFLFSCSRTNDDTALISSRTPAIPVVYVVNYPLAYFAERIGGDLVEVVFPVAPDVDPVFWAPDADDIIAFQKADVILLNGANYAKWTEYASLPLARIVNTSASFSDAYLRTTRVGTHSHGLGGDHSHTGTAFTTWLDLRRATEQAAAVRGALAALLPENGEALSRNFASLETDLISLDDELQRIISANAVAMLASHPVYDYLANRYGLQLTSVLWEPEVVPEEKKWRELQQIQAHHPSRWMIWEGEPAAESVERLTEMGIRSVVFDPCGNRPDEGDFLSVMRSNVENIEVIFSR